MRCGVFDSGISLWGADDAEVYHNTVASTLPPSASSIEWRFISTSVTVKNNLVTDRIWDRGGTGYTASNLEYAPLNLFVGVASGDLHLVGSDSSPVDAGEALPPGLCDGDFDGSLRDGAPDIGADEFGQPLFADGYETGDTNSWNEVIE